MKICNGALAPSDGLITMSLTLSIQLEAKIAREIFVIVLPVLHKYIGQVLAGHTYRAFKST